MREAMLDHAGQGDVVVCDACADRCRLGPSVCGLCGVRANRDGALLTFSDDRIASAEIVPVERAPFFHVRPGSLTLAVAGVGDNFHCRYCTTWTPTRLPRFERAATPGRRAAPRTIVASVFVLRVAKEVKVRVEISGTLAPGPTPATP